MVSRLHLHAPTSQQVQRCPILNHLPGDAQDSPAERERFAKFFQVTLEADMRLVRPAHALYLDGDALVFIRFAYLAQPHCHIEPPSTFCVEERRIP